MIQEENEIDERFKVIASELQEAMCNTIKPFIEMLIKEIEQLRKEKEIWLRICSYDYKRYRRIWDMLIEKNSTYDMSKKTRQHIQDLEDLSGEVMHVTNDSPLICGKWKIHIVNHEKKESRTLKVFVHEITIFKQIYFLSEHEEATARRIE